MSKPTPNFGHRSTVEKIRRFHWRASCECGWRWNTIRRRDADRERTLHVEANRP